MRSSLALLFLILAVVCVQQTSGIFFYLKEGQDKCFMEELPEHTIVVVEVDASDISVNAVIPGNSAGEISRRKNADTDPLQIQGTVAFGKENVVEQTIPAKGRFAFTSQEPGEYKICLKTSSSRWFGAGAVVRLLSCL